MTEAALIVNALLATLPLLVIESVANKVNVVPVPVALVMDTPEEIVKLPETATVTLAEPNADEIAEAKLASTTKSVGSSIQLPTRPAAAATFTDAVLKIDKVPNELVSTEPPLPPRRPPIAISVPPIVV